MTQGVIKVRNNRTGRDKFYEKSTNKLIAFYEEADTYGIQELTITEYGVEQGYCAYNGGLLDRNTGRILFKRII